MLEMRKVCKSFGDLPVIDRLDLTVGDDEILALIGPSGCGKTTLLNLISGLKKADSGEIIGADQKISYMFQSARLLPWRTVFENIRLVNEEAGPEEVRSLIDEVGLSGFEKYYPGQLSGGMAKRCALARAFHCRGDLLLMDEPFQGLDYGLRMEMLAMLLRVWRKRKQPVLFVTHEIDEALTVATRVAVLTARPASVQDIFLLPGSEGRDCADPALEDIRRSIIQRIAPGRETAGLQYGMSDRTQ